MGERNYGLTDVGYKYHFSDFAAAMGLANLDGFAERLARRRGLVQQYKVGVQNVAGLTHFVQQPDRESAHWLFGFHVENRGFIRALKSRSLLPSVLSKYCRRMRTPNRSLSRTGPSRFTTGY